MPASVANDKKRDAQPLVLLVEDIPSIAEPTRELLELAGYSVLYVFDALQAQWYIDSVKVAGECMPDLILLGNLNNKDQVVSFLESLDANFEKSLPVVLLTDLPDEVLYTMPNRIRAIGIVVSPSKPEDLLQLVGPVLQVEAEEIAEQESNN